LEIHLKQAVEKVICEVRERTRELKWQGKRARREERYRKVREEISEGLTGEEGWKRVREMRDIIEEGDEEEGE
jgi:hypothetical protein